MDEEIDHAMEEFIREITRHQPALVAFLRSLLPGHPDPRDVLQEVNITLWKKRKKYESGTNFKAWAFKIARYHALNERRSMKRSQMFVFDDDIMDELSQSAAITPTSLDERLLALRICREKLKVKEIELLKIRYAVGISIEKHAEIHNKNAGTIRATLRRIRNKLRICINHQMENAHV